MSKRIVYKNKDNSIGIIAPSLEALSFATIQQIAEKDVPSPYKIVLEWGKDENDEDIVTKWGEYNTPYWIIEDSMIPLDRVFRNAWEIDESFGDPDGYGGESNEFDSELLNKFRMVQSMGTEEINFWNKQTNELIAQNIQGLLND